MFKCILCSNENYTDIYPRTRDNDTIKVVACAHCGHVQLDRLPSDDFYNDNQQLKRIYQTLDIEKLREKSSFDTNRRLELIGRQLDDRKSFLELGIGYGFLMEAALEAGLDIDGIEIGQERREATESRIGKEIYDYDMCSEDAKKLTKKYDYIMFFQVLEHVLEPIPFLRNIHEALEDGGQVVIEVPHYNDHMISISEPYRAFYYQEAHQSYYTYETLKRLLKEVGFKEIQDFYEQRYSIENFMAWYVNGEPQIEKPAYIVSEALESLDKMYKSYLIGNKKTDTLIVIATK